MERYPDKEKKEEVFMQSEPKKKEKEKKYQVTFRENRSYELRIQHAEFRFQPRGREGDSQILTEKQIKHPDFLSAAKRFAIKEL